MQKPLNFTLTDGNNCMYVVGYNSALEMQLLTTLRETIALEKVNGKKM